MPLPPPSNTELQDLRDRTQYEAWFLDAVYEIGEESSRDPGPSQIVYSSDGAPGRKIANMAGRCVIGDWRGGFLKTGAPLVFITSFKLLDMILEWILDRNGRKVGFRFQEKLKQLDSSIDFPDDIELRPWLRERLLGLYRGLEPLRGTVMHERHFTSANGELEVSPSKKGVVGPAVALAQADIRLLARLVIHTLGLVTGDAKLDRVQEKRMRHSLDQLLHLHGQRSLSQLWPERMEVRIDLKANDSPRLDLDLLRADAARLCINAEPVFLQVVFHEVVAEATAPLEWRVPWSEVNESAGVIAFTRAQLEQFRVTQTPQGPDEAHSLAGGSP